MIGFIQRWGVANPLVGHRPFVHFDKSTKARWALNRVLVNMPHGNLDVASVAPIPRAIWERITSTRDVRQAKRRMFAPEKLQPKFTLDIPQRIDNPSEVRNKHTLIAHAAKVATTAEKSIHLVRIRVVENALCEWLLVINHAQRRQLLPKPLQSLRFELPRTLAG